ncbi:unnamed protein product [Sphagnum balticum]
MTGQTQATTKPCRTTLSGSTKPAPEQQHTCPPPTPHVQPQPQCVPVKILRLANRAWYSRRALRSPDTPILFVYNEQINIPDCYAVTYRYPPDSRCYIYRCRSQDECPLRPRLNTTTAFLRLPVPLQNGLLLRIEYILDVFDFIDNYIINYDCQQYDFDTESQSTSETDSLTHIIIHKSCQFVQNPTLSVSVRLMSIVADRRIPLQHVDVQLENVKPDRGGQALFVTVASTTTTSIDTTTYYKTTIGRQAGIRLSPLG